MGVAAFHGDGRSILSLEQRGGVDALGLIMHYDIGQPERMLRSGNHGERAYRF
jgi:ribosomal protein S6E (S10)